MQFELLFLSICDFVKIDVLARPSPGPPPWTLLSTILCLDRFFLAGCLFFCLLIPIIQKEFYKKSKSWKETKEPEKILPHNLKEKQGPQNRLVLRVFDLYFKKLNFFTIFLTNEKDRHIFFKKRLVYWKEIPCKFLARIFFKICENKTG